MIYITGDTHGDFRNVERFCEKMQTSEDDVLIILGDAGINYYGPEQDKRKKKYLESLPINDDCIYTPGVVVFKSDTDYPQLLPEEKWYSVNVLTCAAPNLRERPSNEMNAGDGDAAVHISGEDLQALHEKRMRRVLEIAWAKGNEVVILGAFGCGAFRNPPAVVAQAMKTVVQEYRMRF